MPIKLSEADRILKNAYLYLLNEKAGKKKSKHITKGLCKCCKCGKGNTTLRKLQDGQYICNNCLKEQQNER